MKYQILYYLIFNALLSVAQSSAVFEHEYFLNSLSEINNKNIDSIKIYSGSMDNKDSAVLIEVYVFRNVKNCQVIDRKKNILSPTGQIFSYIKRFYVKKNVVDSVSYEGVQDGVFIVRALNRRVIDYDKGQIKRITVIENNYMDSAVYDFVYKNQLVSKVSIEYKRHLNEKVKSSQIVFINYYVRGEELNK